MLSNTSTVYDVRMRTSIGDRFGRITVTQNQERISGFFDILNHNEPFEGTVDEDGNCSFTGKIVTLMRTIQYQAIGKILPNEISLTIRDGHHTIKITGNPIKDTKEPC
ncbi:MAG: hypothetical protein ACI3XR_04345 [Eubacteriales bacterium]